MIPHAKREPECRGAAEERQVEARAQADVLEDEETEADGRDAEREPGAHALRVDVDEGRIDETIERYIFADLVDEAEVALENDVDELHRDVDLLAGSGLETNMVELRADQRLVTRRQFDLELLERAGDAKARRRSVERGVDDAFQPELRSWKRLEDGLPLELGAAGGPGIAPLQHLLRTGAAVAPGAHRPQPPHGLARLRR